MKNWNDGNTLLSADRSYLKYWILPDFRFDEDRNCIVLAGARVFECLKNDGAYITVQEHSVDRVDGELWVGWEYIGKPMRKRLRHWSGGTAYFLPAPSKRNAIAQQWTGNRLILDEEWSF